MFELLLLLLLLHATSSANARKVDVSEFQVENQSSNFLTNKGFWQEQSVYIRFLTYLKAIYEQK